MSTEKKVLIVIVLNIAITLIEAFFGLLSNSMALIADALHNLGDVLAVVVTYIALIYGLKKPSYKHTYGFKRSEMMAAFINSLFLILTSIFIIYESISSLLEPKPVDGEIMMIVAAVALVVNGASAYILSKSGFGHTHSHGDHEHKHANHNHEHHKHHHEHEDLNIKSAYLHMLGDAIISLGVIAGGAAIYIFGISSIDTILSTLFSIYIIKTTMYIFIKSFRSLMDFNDDKIEPIVEAILEDKNITNVHHLHLNRPSSKDFHISAHLIFKENIALDEIEKALDEAKNRIEKFGINHAVFQPETTNKANQCNTSVLFCQNC